MQVAVYSDCVLRALLGESCGFHVVKIAFCYARALIHRQSCLAGDNSVVPVHQAAIDIAFRNNAKAPAEVGDPNVDLTEVITRRAVYRRNQRRSKYYKQYGLAARKRTMDVSQ